MNKNIHIFFVITLCLLSYFAIKPLLGTGFFPMHDDTQVGRVVAMGRALREGQFPVRWVSDLGYGYGYPIFNFYGPLPYYVGGFFYLLGFSGLVATKLMFILGILASGIFLFFATKKTLGYLGALIASLFYLYAPYHAVQIYVRGSVGEFWVLVFWPLILYGLLHKSIIIGSIGVAGAIMSHTLLGYATVILLIPLFLTHKKHLFFGIIGMGLSAFFWLPAFFERGFTSVSGQISSSANYMDHFVCLSQLWVPVVGFGGSAPGCVDGMSFAVGKMHVLTALLAIVLWLFTKKKKTYVYMCLAMGITLLGLFLVLPISAWVWKHVPQFAYMQYPWRFLTLLILGTSLLCGTIFWYVRGKIYRYIVAGIFIIGILYANQKWFVPQYTYIRQAADFESQSELRFRVSKISDEYLPEQVARPQEQSEAIFDTIDQHELYTVQVQQERATHGIYTIDAQQKTHIRINKPIFPGWRFFVNDNEIFPSRDYVNDGLVYLSVEAGQSIVESKFTNTPVRIVGNLASVVSVLILLLYGKQKKPVS